ncbi:dienelactone hydrolase family protein [Pseudoduganella sp. DS3]|uniref:Dienelactone hydrolase family protein n=1 Tax=Pseudoduganella guangdongensis TaxID=2692179 RepID=A0A6N9HJH8_9BURK|nr:dienelactone hydrolase family protein [Pseudoduganella guangdongensis]MYN03293.1 dienelactone hydrolase family protein [Pseudoduganella guangdongensis]
MPRLTATDFDPSVLQLFDKYVHGQLSRRDFIAAAGAGMLAAMAPSFAAPLVAADDARLKTSYVEYPSPQGYGSVRGYLARPAKAGGKLPTVLVVHENRGLNPHIEDITRRLALEGFLAFAPDALFPLGGYPGNEDKARELFGKLDQAKTRADFVAAYQALAGHEAGNGKVGVVGFCYGGAMANYLATVQPDLAAAVPFYGSQPAAAEAARIKAPLLIHDAENDARIRAGWPAYEAALKAAGVRYEYHLYPGVEHGFNNDTTPRYDEAAARLAWQRTVAFLRRFTSGT